jgi:hypothetical protein
MDESRDIEVFGETDLGALERAEAFARDPDVLVAWAAFEATEGGTMEELKKHFERHGVEVPEGLSVMPLGFPRIPDTDIVPWTIQLSRCRTYFRSDEPGEPPNQQTVCIGFEIVPG